MAMLRSLVLPCILLLSSVIAESRNITCPLLLPPEDLEEIICFSEKVEKRFIHCTNGGNIRLMSFFMAAHMRGQNCPKENHLNWSDLCAFNDEQLIVAANATCHGHQSCSLDIFTAVQAFHERGNCCNGRTKLPDRRITFGVLFYRCVRPKEQKTAPPQDGSYTTLRHEKTSTEHKTCGSSICQNEKATSTLAPPTHGQKKKPYRLVLL